MSSGWKTSEFWLRLLGKGLGAVMFLAGTQQNNAIAQAIAMVSGGLLTLLAQYGYGEQRTELKLAALQNELGKTLEAAKK